MRTSNFNGDEVQINSIILKKTSNNDEEEKRTRN